MTPEQYFSQQIYNLMIGNTPGLDPVATQAYADSVAGMYINLILPNLQVNLTTGTISLVVPSS